MSEAKISEIAVEDAAKALHKEYCPQRKWNSEYVTVQRHWQEQARISITAALPHLHPQPAELAEQQGAES